MRHLLRSAAALVLAASLAACAGAAPPTASAPPSVAPSGQVAGPEDAVARVVAANPQFAGIGPLNNDLIGQCCWYQVTPAAGGFRVTIHLGWGDCPAGCIEKHEWVYSVAAADGAVTLLGESGNPVPAGTLPGSTGTKGPTGIVGTAVAGPTCPVQRENDPNCAPRPVANAIVVVRTPDGQEVARTQTDATGGFRVPVPPGTYTVEGVQQGGGFPIAPAPKSVTVVANSLSNVQLNFDTGIR
jgi:hypothetical protein